MIYLASPYSHPEVEVRQRRYDAALHASVYLLKKGEFVYSPIVHCHYMAVCHKMPEGHEFWEEYDQHMIRLCEKLLVLQIDGWKESKGVQAELLYAVDLGKPVGYL